LSYRETGLAEFACDHHLRAFASALLWKQIRAFTSGSVLARTFRPLPDQNRRTVRLDAGAANVVLDQFAFGIDNFSSRGTRGSLKYGIIHFSSASLCATM
jgi:hypothetical protein